MLPSDTKTFLTAKETELIRKVNNGEATPDEEGELAFVQICLMNLHDYREPIAEEDRDHG